MHALYLHSVFWYAYRELAMANGQSQGRHLHRCDTHSLTVAQHQLFARARSYEKTLILFVEVLFHPPLATRTKLFPSKKNVAKINLVHQINTILTFII